MKILLIGNSGTKSQDKGGQTSKLRLYHQKLIDEGFAVDFVELEGFFKHPFRVFKSIKKGIKQCDRIILISGERACKLLIPFINRHNKKQKKYFVVPLVGSGILHFSIDHLSDEDKYRFMNENHFELGKRRLKISKQLKQVNLILAETELMKKVYSEYYYLDNCAVLNNFRDFVVKDENHSYSKPLKLVFLSRVMGLKGIFDLLEVVNGFDKKDISLDIYGDKHLSKDEDERFNSLLKENVVYKGSIDNEKVIDVLKRYDVFVFPTRAVYEGTPGVIAESLIAGTPILTADFPQAKHLLNNGDDSIFFKMFDNNDLKDKLLNLLDNKYDLNKMHKNALESGKKFTYEFERDNFLKCVCGKES